MMTNKLLPLEEVMTELRLRNIVESVHTGTHKINAVGTEHRDIISPVTGAKLSEVVFASDTEYEAVIKRSIAAFEQWRNVPAPIRGDLVRKFGNKIREHKENLATLITYEMGKCYRESLGEVQEVIDICDFAAGLSRQLYGLSMHSERPHHRMYEQWHPLGVVGIITAFNFPVAVWSWNAMIALICGNTCVWKPSEKTPLSANAMLNILEEVMIENFIPEGLITIVNGHRDMGAKMAADKRIALVSATGSTEMGKSVARTVADRLGKSLLELGGNNAIIVSDKANLELAVRAVVFGAIGTAGQRCTTTRRVIIHQHIYEEFTNRLVHAYGQLTIGSPMDDHVHMGPLIDQQAVIQHIRALVHVQEEGGKLLFGGEVLEGHPFESGCYVKPAIVEVLNHFPTVKKETFSPILYLMKYHDLSQAIEMQNDVPQGLSSAIFTTNITESERFLSAAGSDCGIANVNIGTSGAEIGGAFGGEKDTGGGRESGSDSWKAYMRRQTVTLNYSQDLPLAQGITFQL
jgi:aldehyde dehydrogenase (NAD+)